MLAVVLVWRGSPTTFQMIRLFSVVVAENRLLEFWSWNGPIPLPTGQGQPCRFLLQQTRQSLLVGTALMREQHCSRSAVLRI